ncbi:MAG: PD40 domain-containing protein [Thermoflexales bacterium]|nr:PD40 domain-containing protein [Thermoflexales bacterium]
MKRSTALAWFLLIALAITAVYAILQAIVPFPLRLPLRPIVAISPHNAARMTLLARLGQGLTNEIVWSPDGQQLVVASSIGIHFYDAQTLQETRFIETKTQVSSIALSPDGKWLAAAIEGEVIKVWQVPGFQAHSLPEYSRDAVTVAFSPDSRLLAFVSYDGGLVLWNVLGRREQGAIYRPGALSMTGALGVAFSPDGQVLAVLVSGPPGLNDEGESIELWEVSGERKVRTLAGARYYYRSVNRPAFSPDGTLLAALGKGGTVKIWEVASGREIHALSIKNTLGEGCVRFSPDGLLLATGARSTQLWDVASGRELRTLTGSAESLSFSPDGTSLAAGSRDGGVTVWDATAASGREQRARTRYGVDSLAFSPNGRWLASVSEYYGGMRIWELTSGRELDLSAGQGEAVIGMAFSPDGKLLASGRLDGAIKLWDVEIWSELGHFRHRPTSEMSLAFSPDGRWLASGANDGTVKVWDATAAGGRELHAFQESFSEAVMSLAFSPDGERVMAGSFGGAVKVWEVTGGRQALQLPHYGEKILSGKAFSSDGTMLAVTTDNAVVLRDIPGGREWRTLAEIEREGQVEWQNWLSVAFSPDDSLVAAGSEGGLVKVWEVSSGRELANLASSHYFYVNGVAFSPDGKLLASSHGDNVVRLWGVATPGPDDTPPPVPTLPGDGQTTDPGLRCWTSEPVASVEPSPGGTYQLAFASDRDDNVEIYVMNVPSTPGSVGGTNPTRLTTHSGIDRFPTWSPDGKYIAFDSLLSKHRIYIMNANGANLHPLESRLDMSGIFPAWLPDAEHVAFVSPLPGGGCYDLYATSLEGDITSLDNSRTCSAINTWSPNGECIAYVSTQDGNTDIYVMGAEGAHPTRLTTDAAVDGKPAWSPDGRYIAFESNRDGDYEIYVMNVQEALQGSGEASLVRLTDDPAVDSGPAWSPDGKYIAFESNRDGNDEVYVMYADGATPTRLTENPAADLWPAWSPLLYAPGASTPPGSAPESPTPPPEADYTVSFANLHRCYASDAQFLAHNTGSKPFVSKVIYIDDLTTGAVLDQGGTSTTFMPTPDDCRPKYYGKFLPGGEAYLPAYIGARPPVGHLAQATIELNVEFTHLKVTRLVKFVIPPLPETQD